MVSKRGDLMPKKRPDGRVVITKTINGKRHYFYGATRKEARAKCDDALMHYEQRQQHGEPFEDVARAFWTWKEPLIKYGTRQGYRHKVEVAISWFGRTGMREITATDINRELLRMQKQGYSYKLIANQKSVLSLIWQYWCAELGGDQNPVLLLRLPKGLPKKRRHAPTDEEVALVRAHSEGFGLCAAFMMYAGLRIGEILALQWQDVQGGQISVTKAVVWHSNQPVIETPKTENAIRTVPILAPLAALLDPAGHEPQEYIFGGDAPYTKARYENAWLQYLASFGCTHDTGQRRATGKTSIDGKPLYKPIMAPDFTAHQLRHEYASTLVQCGISQQVAKEFMGHADIITTQRWYAEAKSSAVQEATDILNAHFVAKK